MTGRRLRILQSIGWPVAVRVPLVMALLMVAISIVISNRVLTRLEETQERNLQELASAYLDGLSASLLPSVVREDVWEVFDTLDRSRQRYRGLNVQWVMVTDADGVVIAASDPARFPSLAPLPAEITAAFADVDDLQLAEHARLARPLIYQDRNIGRIYAEADVSALMQERADVLWELIFTNVLLTVLLIAFGYYFMRRMLKPVSLLANHLSHGRQGTITPIPEAVLLSQSREFQELFARYNEMAQAVNDREILTAELAEEEKLASVGRLASGMAHEINNPLGGMLNALDALKKYGTREEVRATSVRLLEQGLTGIRDLVRATLATYRSDQQPRDLTSGDLQDLRLLLKPEARRKRLHLNWLVDAAGPIHVPAVPVRDAVLNLLLNACHSSRDGGSVALRAMTRRNVLEIEVADEGGGLPSHVRDYMKRNGAGAAPLDRRSGLGLWIVKRHCDELGARLEVVKSDAAGTTIRMTVPLAGEFERAA